MDWNLLLSCQDRVEGTCLSAAEGFALQTVSINEATVAQAI